MAETQDWLANLAEQGTVLDVGGNHRFELGPGDDVLVVLKGALDVFVSEISESSAYGCARPPCAATATPGPHLEGDDGIERASARRGAACASSPSPSGCHCVPEPSGDTGSERAMKAASVVLVLRPLGIPLI